MRFQRKTFSCEALRRNLLSGVASRQLISQQKRRDFQSSPETSALSVQSGLVLLASALVTATLAQMNSNNQGEQSRLFAGCTTCPINQST